MQLKQGASLHTGRAAFAAPLRTAGWRSVVSSACAGPGKQEHGFKGLVSTGKRNSLMGFRSLDGT
jgi:hypothetical protein